MNSKKLTIAQLMEGGLAQLFANPVAVALFVLADGAGAYSVFWALVRYDLGFMSSIAIGLAYFALASSLLVLALGGGLHQVLTDPVELFVRLVFAIAASLIVNLAMVVGLVLLIVPGLYILARWAIVPPLILIQGAGIREALSRSWALTEQSAWTLLGVGLIIEIPNVLLSAFGGFEVGVHFLAPSPSVVLGLIASALIVAFQVAVVVFAFRELAPAPNDLAETFA